MSSDYQTLRQLQYKAKSQKWQHDKRELELSKLLADFIITAKKTQGGDCGRCLSPLDTENVQESNHGTYVHIKCPSTRPHWLAFWRFWGFTTRYLRRYGL